MKALIVVAILLWFGGSLTWAHFDAAEKQKQARITTEQAEKAAIESQEIEAKNAETHRRQSLKVCLAEAEVARYGFEWNNAVEKHKDGSFKAPTYIFQMAETQYSNDVNQCQVQWVSQ